MEDSRSSIQRSRDDSFLEDYLCQIFFFRIFFKHIFNIHFTSSSSLILSGRVGLTIPGETETIPNEWGTLRQEWK